MVRSLKQSFPLSLVIVMFSGLLYIVVQQDMRTAANDPQIQIAEDFAVRLENGETPEIVNQMTKVDMTKSLAPFVSVYDSGGKLLVSNAVLDGGVPSVPVGVLEYAKTHGKHTVTWQPRPGVRNAVVVEPYKGVQSGYVVVGRSLREIEKREEQLTLQIGIGLFAMLLTIFVVQKVFKA
ncbi:MAG: hypothetical protein AAB482_01630 [Patescibacteria group bacterium]